MRFLIARHAETVYNANARMQGQMAHTPLTRAGFAQAEAMGAAIARFTQAKSATIDLWASPSGRTLQTAAIIAEHLRRDFFEFQSDPRLLEIDVGDWQGRRYADIVAEQGEILCPRRRLFTMPPPGGEYYPQVASRLESWLSDLDSQRDVLVISHGQTLRVLRGMLAGGNAFADVVIADDSPQGSVYLIEDRRQTLLHRGENPPVAGAI